MARERTRLGSAIPDAGDGLRAQIRDLPGRAVDDEFVVVNAHGTPRIEYFPLINIRVLTSVMHYIVMLLAQLIFDNRETPYRMDGSAYRGVIRSYSPKLKIQGIVQISSSRLRLRPMFL